MAKVLGNFKQVVNFARVLWVPRADVEQLVMGRLPPLGGRLSHAKPVNMKVSDDLLLPNCSEIFLHRWLGSVHSCPKTTMKTFYHVGGSRKLRIIENPGIVIPELQLSFNVLGESRHDESNAMLLGFIVRFIYLENPFINSWSTHLPWHRFTSPHAPRLTQTQVIHDFRSDFHWLTFHRYVTNNMVWSDPRGTDWAVWCDPPGYPDSKVPSCRPPVKLPPTQECRV